jgi:hypothetical protein
LDLIGPADVAKILGNTSKRLQLSPDQAALKINLAIRRCLERIGPEIASPPSKHEKWAISVVKSLTKSLELLAPSAGKTSPPTMHDWAESYSRLARKSGSLIEEDLRTLDSALTGIWKIRAMAQEAAVTWRKMLQVSPDRRTADRVRLIWVHEMSNLWEVLLIEAKAPSAPVECSPFIRFIDNIRMLIIKRSQPFHDRVYSSFLTMLQKAERRQLALFIAKNKLNRARKSPRT